MDRRKEATCLFVNEAPIDIAMVDIDGRLVAASPTFLVDSPVHGAMVVGRFLWDVVPDIKEGFQETRSIMLSGASQTDIRSHVLPDGRLRWFRSESTPWRGDSGEVGGYFFIIHDVTAEHEAQAARRDLEILLRAVIDNIPASISVHDLETGVFALANTAAADLVEHEHGTLVGTPLERVLDENRLAGYRASLLNLKHSSGVQVMETLLEGGAMAGRIMRFKRLMFTDELGRHRLLSVGDDVTEMRAATRALEGALAKAEQANEAKTAFLATMSHEVRTPLNGVLGMVQAMARDELPEAQRRRLEVVRQSGEALLAIVNDALDLSKIEAGRLELEEIDFDLAELLEGVSASFQALAGSKGVDFVVDLEGAEGVYRGDPTRVRQIVSNLISNAVKFTARGEIRVEVRRPDEGTLAFSISDTGIGMTPSVLEHLFEKYVQGDRSTTRRFGGTGLGLAICRQLVELMGGSIHAESQPGQGARFHWSAPLRRVSDPRPRQQAAMAASDFAGDLRVLAAEDNAVNRQLLSTIFEQVGIGLTLVEDGAAAVDAYGGQGWDLILMDVQMPVMDGREATRIIREMEARRRLPRTPIIGLTADIMAHQRAAHLACGMDAVVAKPLQIEELFAAIEAELVPDACALDEPERLAV